MKTQGQQKKPEVRGKRIKNIIPWPGKRYISQMYLPKIRGQVMINAQFNQIIMLFITSFWFQFFPFPHCNTYSIYFTDSVMSQYPWLLLLLLLSVTAQNCQPLFPRIFYDPVPATELKVDMIVMFNTLSRCPDSYLHAKFLNSEDEFPCTVQPITIAGPTVPYLQQYVHSCDLEIDSASQVSQFTYTIFSGKQTVSETVELASDSLPFRIVILANTNMLDQAIYRPFAEAFQQLLERREQELQRKEGENYYRMNGIVINGGFADGFTANKGENFNKIMRMVSQFSTKWPLMINLGPTEITSEVDFALIQKCFVLGGIGSGAKRKAMQGFSFARKANLAFVETSQQYYSSRPNETTEFNVTLKALDSFFSNNQQNGNEFSIVFNHFPLFCSNKDDGSPYNCQKGEEKLAALKSQLSTPASYPPADLYFSAFLNDYERNYPYHSKGFMTLEQSRYGRGDFINVNEGAGGLGLTDPVPKTQMMFTAVREIGSRGFGMLTIKGNGELRKKNQSAVIETQTAARQIYDKQAEKHTAGQSDNSVLDEDYLKQENLVELDLFLLNYKHVLIGSNGELTVGDVFRIVSDPQGAVNRHQLRAE